jgi:nucleoside-diphosphate-sugar epimerase
MAARKPSDHDQPGDEFNGAREPEDIALPVFDPNELESFEDDADDEDDVAIDDDALSDLIEEEPRTVLITGACGNIGRKLRDAWVDIYDLVLIDKAPSEDDLDVIVADLENFDNDWITHFHGVDTVVHLAALGDEFAPWEALIGPNLDALANVFHAAALAGVERIIFASSNHVMGAYERMDDEPITVDMQPMPDGPYAVTKLVGERLGQSLARAFDLTFIALRLGWVQEGKNRPETLPHDWARKMWLSNADLIRLFDCAVEAEIEEPSFVVVNGVSRNHGTRWDLSDAAELLGYLPTDNAFDESHRSSC